MKSNLEIISLKPDVQQMRKQEAQKESGVCYSSILGDISIINESCTE